MNLTEATILALQGKLVEEKPVRAKKSRKQESVAIANDDVVVNVEDNKTEIVTAEETVTVEPVNMEAPVGEPVPEEVEVDETTIEDVLPEETEETPTIDEIVDGETEADVKDLEESKKIEEAIRDDHDLNIFLAWELRNKNEDLAKFITTDPDEVDDCELVNYVRAQIESELDYKLDQVIDSLDLDQFQPLEESKKVQENVEIEVSEDGKEVEVTTDEGENVEVVDETEEPETSDEAEQAEETEEEVETEVIEESKKVCEDDECTECEFTSVEEALAMIEKATAFIKESTAEVIEEPVEDEVEVEETEDEVIEESINTDSFNKVLSEFYNKDLDLNVVKEGKDLKITGEGLSLTLTESSSKHNVTKYELQESKEPMSIVTLLKNNELNCKFISK